MMLHAAECGVVVRGVVAGVQFAGMNRIPTAIVVVPTITSMKAPTATVTSMAARMTATIPIGGHVPTTPLTGGELGRTFPQDAGLTPLGRDLAVASADSRECQTSTATLAGPGLSLTLIRHKQRALTEGDEIPSRRHRLNRRDIGTGDRWRGSGRAASRRGAYDLRRWKRLPVRQVVVHPVERADQVDVQRHVARVVAGERRRR